MRGILGNKANAGGVVSRVAMQAQQFAGKAEATKDESFDVLTIHFKDVCIRAEANEKAMELHKHAVLGQISAYAGIAKAAEDLYPEEDRDVLQIFEQAASGLASSTKERFEAKYTEKIGEPLQRYRQDLTLLSGKLTQRNSMRLDYDAARAGLQKLVKKPPKDGSKLQKAEAMTQQTGTIYNMINQEVMSRMQYYA